MSASVLPLHATNSAVTWSVNDPSIATIDAATGLLTAKGNGTVTVTATAQDGSGVTGTVMVTVSNQSENGKPFLVNATGTGLGLIRSSGDLQASVDVSRSNNAGYVGEKVIVFQLLKNGTEAIQLIALKKDIQLTETLSAKFFNINGNDSMYSVKVFVFDQLTTDLTSVQKSLAESVILN